MKRGGRQRKSSVQSKLTSYYGNSSKGNVSNPGPSTSVGRSSSSPSRASFPQGSRVARKGFNQLTVDRDFYEQGCDVRAAARIFLDEFGKDSSLIGLETGRLLELTSTLHPNFTSKLQYGMVNTEDRNTNIQTYHCIVPCCMQPPKRLSTRCEEHLDTDLSSFISAASVEHGNEQAASQDAAKMSVSSYEMDKNNSSELMDVAAPVFSSSDDSMGGNQKSAVGESQKSSSDGSVELFNYKPDPDDEFPDVATQMY